MGLFKDILKADETLVSNESALEFDFIPKILPFREEQQKYVATCISPLIKCRMGKHLFVHGPPGVGKTASVKWVLRDLEQETDEVYSLFVNCWHQNTTYKVLVNMCDQLGYKFTQNKKTSELFKIIKTLVNKKSAVFVFDEVDKLEDFDLFYMIIEEILKCSIIMITNYKEWLIDLDQRIKSRITADMLEFDKYKAVEIEGILKDRLKYAFYQGVWNGEAFDLCVDKAYELGDVRQGIYLLRESASIAEDHSSRKISIEHTKQAIKKLDEFCVKDSTDLGVDSQLILDIIKKESEAKIGDVYRIYREKGGVHTSKTLQRKIEKLEKAKFITTKKTGGGVHGNTTIVSYKKNKSLSEF